MHSSTGTAPPTGRGVEQCGAALLRPLDEVGPGGNQLAVGGNHGNAEVDGALHHRGGRFGAAAQLYQYVGVVLEQLHRVVGEQRRVHVAGAAAVGVVHGDADDLEALFVPAQPLVDGRSHGAQPHQRNASASRRSPGVAVRFGRSEPGTVLGPRPRDVDGVRVRLGVLECFGLHQASADLGGKGPRGGEVRHQGLLALVRVGGEEARHVLDQTALDRLQLVPEKDGRQIGSAAPEQGGHVVLVAPHESANNNHVNFLEGFVEGGGVDTVRGGVQAGAAGAQRHPVGLQHLRGNPQIVELKGQPGGACRLPCGQQAGDGGVVHVGETGGLGEQRIGDTGERRHHRDHPVTPPDLPVDLEGGDGQILRRMEYRTAKLEDTERAVAHDSGLPSCGSLLDPSRWRWRVAGFPVIAGCG